MANENLKKQMVIKLGTTTNEDAQIINNMVDNAAGGGGSGGSSLILTADENFAIDHTNSEIVSAYDSGKAVILAVDHEGVTVHESLVMYQTNSGMYMLFFSVGQDKTTPSAADAYPVLN